MTTKRFDLEQCITTTTTECHQKQEDASLQLTEEEMETLSVDDILKRFEQALAMEEALEEASFWQEPRITAKRKEEQTKAQTTKQAEQLRHPTSTTTTMATALPPPQSVPLSSIP